MVLVCFILLFILNVSTYGQIYDDDTDTILYSIVDITCSFPFFVDRPIYGWRKQPCCVCENRKIQ